MEKFKTVINFIVNYRFIIAFIILLIMLIIQFVLVIPLYRKFNEMENIPLGEAEAEARFNELNNFRSSSFSNESEVSDDIDITADL